MTTDFALSNPPDYAPHQLRALRVRLDLTQEEMAAKLDVRSATVSRWERGVQRPSERARRRIQRLAERTR